jgi:hypothetical protein
MKCRTYLGLLSLRGHDKELSCWVYDLDLSDDGSGIGCYEKSAKVIYYEFIST